MAVGGYLIHVPQEHYASLDRRLALALKRTAGYPLLPVSSGRALITSSNFKEIRNSLGRDRYRKLLKRHRVERVEAVDESRFLALLQSRDPADLPKRSIESPRPRGSSQRVSLDWYLSESRLDEAWDLFGGRDKINWDNVSVGHVDTGWTFHRALGFSGTQEEENSPWVNTNDDRNFFSGDFDRGGEGAPPPLFPVDPHSARDRLEGPNGGHGTKTLSVLCGSDESSLARDGGGGNAGFAGYFGAAPKVPVVPVRICNTIWIELELGEGLPKAINHLVETMGCGVISLSMGSPYVFTSPRRMPLVLQEAIDNAYEKGVILVCAAGNHIPNEHVVFPARCPRTIAVAGSTLAGKPWSGSSYGMHVDISAPACPVRRAMTSWNGVQAYDYGDGTSFATPQVAGTAALWLAYRGDEIRRTYRQPWQIIAAFLQLLKTTARVPDGWETTIRGAGLLDAKALLLEPLPDAGGLAKDDVPFY